MPKKTGCGNCGCPVNKNRDVTCHLPKHQADPPIWFHFIWCPYCRHECWDEHIGAYHTEEDEEE